MSADLEYVITGALMKCSEGASPMPFKATPRTSKIAGLRAGNELDIAPIVNVPSFIICKKLTQMAKGVPVPCIPAPTKWQDTYKAKVGGGNALIKKSCIQCVAGQGKIEFITSGQIPLPPEVVEDIQIAQQKGEKAVEAAEKENNAVGEAGLVEGLIPVWGSGRDLIHSVQTGSVSGMAVNTVFLAWDVVSVVAGAFSLGTATVAMMGAKAGIRTALKTAGKVVVSAAKKQGAEILGKSAAMLKGAINSIKEFGPKIPTKCRAVCCFPAGTPIAIKGGFKNIEHIEVGDEVWSWNVEKGEIGLKSVVNTIESEADALVELGFGMERFKTTPEHPFWVGDSKNGAWKDAGALVEGDQLWLLDKRNVSLSVVDHQPQPENKIKVYNFEVADWHTYFVGWWMVLVHNNIIDCIADYAKILASASSAYKGTTVLGHALSKHAGRNPDIWGKTKGASSTWHDQALKHFDDIMAGPGQFAATTTKGVTFLEKRLADGRGIRLNMDGTFKGFID